MENPKQDDPLERDSTDENRESEKQADQFAPMAEAMKWVSRITTVALEMVVPAIAGQWLDKQWGTSFLVLIGLVLGVSVGLMHLIAMTRENESRNQPGKKHRKYAEPAKSDLPDLDKLRDL
jgi:F0F1-type ATP synthase assembly protein I